MRPLYEVTLDENDESSGVYLISVVRDPAMEVVAVRLNRQEILLAKDASKQYLTSAIIIPDKPIFRSDAANGEYDIVFRAHQIEMMRNRFHESTGNLKMSNIDHSDQPLNAKLIESWIKTSANDKSNDLGFDLPVGTWFATYKILDKEFWDKQIMTGEFKGFSLEGLFNQVKVSMKQMFEKTQQLETSLTKSEVETLLDELISTLEK